MQPPIRALLERFFAATDRFQQRLSDRWRQHANRRSIVIVCIGIVLACTYIYFIEPPRDFPVDRLVTVPEGTLTEIADELESQGVIKSALMFKALIVMFGNEHSARAGDYLFKQPRDVIHIARAVANGIFGLEPIRIRIAEGATTREMAIIFRSRLERFDENNFLPQAQSMEGYLFPDTYFLPNATEDTVIQAMRQNFDTRIAEFMPDIETSGRTLDEIIKMASIIEREARISADRKMISGVLWNRIDRGMALQVDAVFLYSIGKNTFQLTLADLASDSPYNTYKHKGLPPTPIGSPSLDSIRAALYPTKNPNLFYLADNSGTTHYSKTYAEHLRKKRLYLD